ncbi:CDP-glycerol glycerophosphotransferase family protein [Halomonas getboli]|uniref:CDP-glycerol glycerophosphotransferase family protein n=1 Tax=Halomonas getboli TaxID=2935862 RepID=UPI001FFFC0F9|nr:CDP-glycerol glycerophosphotransferase family protein [Halomonas getboli]MCK2183069.1 CDP-glycerol glycerophosphotransferase family protein [Halomonas getboli]
MSDYRGRIIRQLGWSWLCPLARAWPRDPRLWVFGAWHGQRYADNARYLYRHVRDREPDLRAVWLADDIGAVREVQAEGGEAALAYSRAGIAAALRAGACVVTHNAEDVNAHAALGALLVNLTHGTPLKRMGRDARSRRLGRWTRLIDRYAMGQLPGRRLADLMVVASTTSQRRMMSAYGLPEEDVLALGYPRWEAFREDAPALLRRLGVEPREHAGVLLYAPTLRQQGRGSLDVSAADGLPALRDWLARERLLLLVRGHASLRLQGREALAGQPRILEVPVSTVPDVNALLPAVDALITDYSSLMFDYACLERPIILLAPDLVDYRDHDVGLYGDYLADAPGPVIETWSQLPLAWQEVASGRFAERLAGFVAQHASRYDGQSCSRIVAEMRRRLGLASSWPPEGDGGRASETGAALKRGDTQR